MSDRFAPVERIADLIARSVINNLSPEEKKELDAWLSENEENKRLYEKLKENNKMDLDFFQKKYNTH